MIHLVSLHLENFMSIESLDMDFNSNETIAIAGENGAGKSTAMAALAFLWTGYRKGESYKDYIAIGQTQAVVGHKATIKGEPIEFLATIYDRKYGQPVIRKVTYKGNSYVNSEIDELFKQFDIEYLDQVMFLFQDGNNITDLRPGDRGTLLKHLFHFDFTSQVNELKGTLEDDAEAFTRLSVALSEAAKVKIEPIDLNQTMSADEISSIKDNIKTLESNLADLASIDQSMSSKDLLGEMTLAKTQLDSAKTRLNGNLKKIEEMSSVEAPGEFDKRLLEKAATAQRIAEEDFYEKDVSLASVKHQLESLKKQYLADSGNRHCHYCGHEVTDEYLEKLSADLKNAEETFSEQSKDYSAKEDILAKSRKTLKSLEEARRLYDASVVSWDMNQIKLKSLEENNISLEKIILDASVVVKNLFGKYEEIKKLEEATEPLLLKKHELEKSLANAKHLLKVNEENVAINKERSLRNAEKAQQEKTHKEYLSNLQKELSGKLANVDTLKKAIGYFEHEFPNYMILRTCSHIESYINTCIQKVFPAMSVKLSQSRSGINFEYSPRGEGWLSVKMSSGAERASLALAWRIAIAKLYGLDSIMFDEIDASMTDDNSRIIYEFIASLDGFDQIVLISHRKEALRAVSSLSDNVTCFWVSEGVYSLIDDPENL